MPSSVSVDYYETAFSTRNPKEDGKDKYLIGVFQNAAMVLSVEKEIKDAFQFPPPLIGDSNIRLFNDLGKDDPVAIHVRKGADYMSRCWYQNTCPVEYYKNVVEYMRGILANPRFFVFADHPQWVKENFDWFEYTLVDWNPASGPGSHLDMQMMSYCCVKRV